MRAGYDEEARYFEAGVSSAKRQELEDALHALARCACALACCVVCVGCAWACMLHVCVCVRARLHAACVCALVCAHVAADQVHAATRPPSHLVRGWLSLIVHVTPHPPAALLLRSTLAGLPSRLSWRCCASWRSWRTSSRCSRRRRRRTRRSWSMPRGECTPHSHTQHMCMCSTQLPVCAASAPQQSHAG